MANPRYSIIRGDFPSDPRPELPHFRVYTLIGRHTDENGWCTLRQITIANEVGYSRKTVNLAIADLVAWGYVEKQEQDRTGRAIWYRTIMDRPASPPQAADDDEVDDEEGDETRAETADRPVTSTLHVGCNPSGTCNVGVTAGVTHKVTAAVTTRGNTERPLLNDQEKISPPTPHGGSRRRRGREREFENLIEEIRTPDRETVIALLIQPVGSRLKIDAPSPAFALAQLADWAAKFSDGVLTDACKRLCTDRKANAKIADIEDAVKTARKAEQDAEAIRNGPLIFRTTMPDLWERAMAQLPEGDAAMLAGQDFVRRDYLARLGVTL